MCSLPYSQILDQPEKLARDKRSGLVGLFIPDIQARVFYQAISVKAVIIQEGKAESKTMGTLKYQESRKNTLRDKRSSLF